MCIVQNEKNEKNEKNENEIDSFEYMTVVGQYVRTSMNVNVYIIMPWFAPNQTKPNQPLCVMSIANSM